MEENYLSQKKFLLTSLNYYIKSPKNEEKKEEKKIINIPLSFPKIRYRTLDKKELLNIIQFNHSKKEEIFLRNMKTFVAPINKTNLEKKKLDKIKKNLLLKRFKELHNFKLKINPKNYYNNFGLNNYLIISNKAKNKTINDDYKFNNISSYNNRFKSFEKNKTIIRLKNKRKEKEKELNLKRVPYRLINTRNNNGILKFYNNETLTDENSIWRLKNINDMIHNSIDPDFLRNFIKNSKSMGKIKLIK